MSKDVVKSNYETLIFNFRGRKVMIDADLALLYDVSTKALKQQVKRNIGRFPEDFMFELTRLERQELINNSDRLASLKFSNVKPLVFTEQGVSMLSSVLSSEKAIQVNIEIMRAFANYRSLLRENEELRTEIKKLDTKVNKAFEYLMDKLDALHQKKLDIEPIGYKLKKK